MKWKDVLAPGVALAERGMELDWYMQVMIANGAEHLSAKFPASKASYLCDDGRVPTNDWQGTKRYLKLGNLGETTLRRLAEGGPREYYEEGSLARDIASRPAGRRIGDARTRTSPPTKRASSSRCRSSITASP